MYSIFDINKYDNIIECDYKWEKIVKRFTKDFNVYYQYIKPIVSDFELFLFFQKNLLIHEAKVLNNINISINENIPENVSKGIIMIVNNVLLYIETEEEVKEIKDQTNNINKSKAKLSNKKFIENAKKDLVILEEKKLIDFTNLQKEKKLTELLNNIGYDFILLILKFYDIEQIYYHLEYYREQNCEIELYSKEWFDYIYNSNIKEEEILYLKKLEFDN